MINKVTYKEEPNLFRHIEEFSIKCDQEHRRGSNFWTSHIVELKPEDKKWFKDVEDFDKYIGLWETNTIVVDSDHGKDDDFSVLTRVELVEKTVVVKSYVKVE